MNASKKTKLIRKRARLKLRKRKLDIKQQQDTSHMKCKMAKLHQKEGIDIATKQSLKIEAFLTAFHEVGHYIVKSKLLPNERYILRLMGRNGNFYGVVKVGGSNEFDSWEVMAPVSIAGTIAETYGEVNQATSSLQKLRSTRSLFSDRQKFDKSKKRIFDGSPKREVPTMDEFYHEKFIEVIHYLDEFGLENMFDLA